MSIITPTPTTSTSTGYPPLTTIFTPDPECTSLYQFRCSGLASCSVQLYPQDNCHVENSSRSRRKLNCYPASEDGEPQNQYSPGYFCPSGMSTAASAISLNGVWCCPTGLTWGSISPLCMMTLTEGTFISSGGCDGPDSTLTFGPGRSDMMEVEIFTTGYRFAPPGSAEFFTSVTLPLSSIVMTAIATAIFLAGQTSAIETLTGSGPSSTTVSGESALPSNELTQEANGRSDSVVMRIRIGAAVGSTLGALLLACVAFYLFRRRRAKRQRGLIQDSSPSNDYHTEDGQKPELEGSKPRMYTNKAELDPSATRAELEGGLLAPQGDGINIRKPELEGTPGADGVKGLYVKKSELEAPSLRTAAVPAIGAGISELETTPPRRKTEAAL
ncbi:hypothetical protein F4779DRAFT_608409 [Xylariaceae sp. FL0662B]|nr:hypothetical protein F4779DRAFT_608409 [Xylariaceae sp. FL0662B]